jgi:hypothetical protein
VGSRGRRAETKLVYSQSFVPRLARHAKDCWWTAAGHKPALVSPVLDYHNARCATGLTPDLQADFDGELWKEGEVRE